MHSHAERGNEFNNGTGGCAAKETVKVFPAGWAEARSPTTVSSQPNSCWVSQAQPQPAARSFFMLSIILSQSQKRGNKLQ